MGAEVTGESTEKRGVRKGRRAMGRVGTRAAVGRGFLQEAEALTPAECDPYINPGERGRGATHAERAARRRGARGGRACGARPDAAVARGAGNDAAARAGVGAGRCRRPCCALYVEPGALFDIARHLSEEEEKREEEEEIFFFFSSSSVCVYV